jgi:hypothetical protein
MFKESTISRLVDAVGIQPIIVGLKVHKKTDAVALYSSADGQVENTTRPSGEARPPIQTMIQFRNDHRF